MMEARGRGRLKARCSALAGLIAGIGLIDDVDAPFAPDDFVVAVAAAQGFQGVTDFHDNLWVFWLPGS
jgi:hypothetical protein